MAKRTPSKRYIWIPKDLNILTKEQLINLVKNLMKAHNGEGVLMPAKDFKFLVKKAKYKIDLSIFRD